MNKHSNPNLMLETQAKETCHSQLDYQWISQRASGNSWRLETAVTCCWPAAAKSLQSCLTLCDPMDDSPPGSPVPGILQARTLEWVAISSSNAWKWKVKMKSLSRVQPSAIPWTAVFQAPLSMGFSRQEYWSGVPWLWEILAYIFLWREGI